MIKTSYIEILRTFDKDEMKRFEAFLSSPYFNTRNNSINLFSIVKKYSPEFDSKMLEKEVVWKKLFPGKDYNYGLMKNIIFEITKLTERFLEIEEFNNNDKQRMNNLLRKLGDKNLESIFMSKYNSYEKTHFKSTKFYGEFYRDYINFKDIKFEFEAYNPKLRTKLFATEISELLIFDFMAKFSNNFNNVYIEKTEHNEKPDNEFLDIFNKTVFSNKELENYLVELSNKDDKKYKTAIVFFKLMKSYLNPKSIDSYFEFKNILFQNDKFIEESTMRGMYASLGSALDNCKDVMTFNKNQELYDIINHLIEKNIFVSEDGKVLPTLYLMTIKTSAYLKKHELIEKLIKEFLPKIDPSLMENFKMYSLAYLHYSKNEFDKSLEYSNKISIDTFQLKYFLKNLQIIISFEKNDYEMFLFLNDTHKHFLSKNKSVSESYKESNMKFLNYTNSLFKLKESSDKTEFSFTENAILNDVVVNKYWLIEKLKEMDNK